MESLFKVFLTASILLLLSSCASPQNNSNENKETPNVDQETPTENEPDANVEEPDDADTTTEEPEDTDTTVEEPDEQEPDKKSLSDLFMSDGTIAKYAGEGNEYASYRSRTQWHNDNTVSIFEENCGTTMLRTYRIKNDAIVLIKEQGEYYEEFNPSDEELDSLSPLSTYLQLPLEVGATFNNWEIISVNKEVETPYQTFTDVIVMEKTEDSGSINRKYIAENYGEIKREFISIEGDQEYIVTSTLESVE